MNDLVKSELVERVRRYENITGEAEVAALWTALANSRAELYRVFDWLVPNGLILTRHGVLIELMYMLGRTNFINIQAMVPAVNRGDWDGAADALLGSPYTEEPHVAHLAELLRTGYDPQTTELLSS